MKDWHPFTIFLAANLAGCGANIVLSTPPLPSDSSTVLTPLTGVSSLASGKFNSHFSCALTTAGLVLCWGDNSKGQLGDGTQILKSSAVPVSGLSSGVTSLSLGNGFAMAVVNGYILSWGANSFYSLGDGTLTDRLTPVAVAGLPGSSSGVTAGSAFGCSLQSGTTYCWGQNSSGQLGVSNTDIGTLPGAAYNSSGTPYTFTIITSGMNHVCTLNSGQVYCWGDNSYNQVGDGMGQPLNSPTANTVLASGVLEMSAGANHTCAIISNNTVYCWGANNYGQLGLGTVTLNTCPSVIPSPAPSPCSTSNPSTSTNPITPLPISGLPLAVKIYSGAYHSCALVTGGNLYCWGRNDWGQLGTGAVSAYSSVPVLVSVLSQKARSMALGMLHSCAILEDATVKCWGHNGFGELGDGTITSSLTPVSVQK
ncbi:MAG: chromosome condensation regulator RCC1 [Bdellovibrionia bacterium]